MKLDKLQSVKSANPTFPLKFSVMTEDDHNLFPVIYIENFESAHNLHWAIMNESTQNLWIKALEGDPSKSNYHFQLKFRPGTLSENFINEESPLGPVNTPGTVEWKIKIEEEKESKIVYVSLLASKVDESGKYMLTGGKHIDIVLKKITANPVGGARNTNVEFLYNHVYNDAKESNYLTGTNIQHLGILVHSGIRTIPLLVEASGSATVLNNGDSNRIGFQITNYSSRALELNTQLSAPTKIEVMIYAPPSPEESGEQFLSEHEKLKDFELNWHNLEEWEAEPVDNDLNPRTWLFTNKKQSCIEPGKFISFDIDNLRTTLPQGYAKVLINCYNFIDYWDNRLTVEVEKSPLVFRGKRVGIGTNEPIAGLDIRDQVNIKDTNNCAVFYTPSSDVGAYFFRSGTPDNYKDLGRITQGGVIYDSQGPVMPKGAIILWSGAENEIPPGWALCDGQNGTPNLKGRFVVGAGDAYPTNTLGGSDKVTLSIENMPSHSHEVNDPGHTHQYFDRYSPETGHHVDEDNDRPLNRLVDEERKTEPAYTGISIQNNGGTQPFDNRPPYYALCYIMKL